MDGSTDRSVPARVVGSLDYNVHLLREAILANRQAEVHVDIRARCSADWGAYGHKVVLKRLREIRLAVRISEPLTFYHQEDQNVL